MRKPDPTCCPSDPCAHLLSSAPLTVWRTLPRDAIGAEAVSSIAAVLNRVRYPSRDWDQVPMGQDDAAIRIAMAELRCDVARRPGLVDLAFTGVLLAALLTSPAAALVLAHGLVRVLGPERGLPLALSWDLVPLLAHGAVLMRPVYPPDAPASNLPTITRRGMLRLVVDNQGHTDGEIAP